MTSAVKIKKPETPFRTKPDHEHDFVKFAEYRKYDVKRCNVVGPHAEGKKDPQHRARPCGKVIFVLRRKIRGKRAQIAFKRPDVIVPLRLKDVRASREFLLVK